MSSLIVSLSSVVDLIEGHIDDAATNKVCWGRSVLTATLPHFPKLQTELKLLGSRHNADLTEGQLDALWTQMCQASESLALSIPPSVACDSPDDTRKE
jgi:hypothetical protein